LLEFVKTITFLLGFLLSFYDSLGIGSKRFLLLAEFYLFGINGAFSTISTAEGVGRSDALAGDISLALVTTIMGLILAIPTTAAVTYFRNRIDGLATDIATIVDDLALHLEQPNRKQGARTGV